MAKEAKVLELSLVTMIRSSDTKRTEVSKEMNELVDKIAKKKASLTKHHLKCIIDVQNILTKEQRKKVATYAGTKQKK